MNVLDDPIARSWKAREQTTSGSDRSHWTSVQLATGLSVSRFRDSTIPVWQGVIHLANTLDRGTG